MYVCKYVCMYVSMYVCMYVCISQIYMYNIYIYNYIHQHVILIFKKVWIQGGLSYPMKVCEAGVEVHVV